MKNISDETKSIVESLKKFYKPEKVILFGSAAAGTAGKNSDIDLLIVKESKKKRPFRVKDVFDSIDGLNRDFALDVIVYTPSELAERLAIGDYFVEKVLREGKVLYG